MKGKYINGAWSGDVIAITDHGWDHSIQNCWDSVSPKVLQKLARRCFGKRNNFPGGTAGNKLHGMIFCGLVDAGMERGDQGRNVAASMLMGLAEEGTWTP